MPVFNIMRGDIMAKRLCQITYESPIGDLAIVASDQAIIQISLVQSSDFNKDENAHQLCLNCQKQLEEYFLGERETFDLPIAYEGTPFQQKVWKALQNVPYGAVTNYKELAIAVGNKRGYRAVAKALHDNPILIMIPCHRVIASNGTLSGYAAGKHAKAYLLELEGFPVEMFF